MVCWMQFWKRRGTLGKNGGNMSNGRNVVNNNALLFVFRCDKWITLVLDANAGNSLQGIWEFYRFAFPVALKLC